MSTEIASENTSSGGVRRPFFRRVPSHIVIAAVTVVVMIAVWFVLALLYSGIGGAKSVNDVRGIMTAVTSTKATAGSLSIQGILATPEYFSVADRGDGFFGLAPEANLVTITRDPAAFDALDQSASALAIDPARMLPMLLMVDVHEGEIPDPAVWLSGVTLSLDGQELAPVEDYSVAFRSEHHVTLALQFPRADEAGRAIASDVEGTLDLAVPNLEAGSGALHAQWTLPLQFPAESSGGLDLSFATLAGILAIMGGLLVVFSPCALHMTAFFLPVVTGLGIQEIKAKQGEVEFRAHVALSGIAFVAGFVVLYTVFGVLAGLAGQFFSDTAQLEPYLMPIRIIAGTVVIYLALQTLGVFRLPFVVSLKLPGKPHQLSGSPRQGYVGAAIAGMTISFGCLVCVGGTLLAVLLVFAGASSSPLTGGLTLFLFAVGMSLPFLLVAFAFDRVLPRFQGARRFLQYSTPIAGGVMLVLGLLIISGYDNLFEELLV